MIRHVVLLALRDDHDPADLSAVMQGLSALGDSMPGFNEFSHGPNRDFEGKSADFPYGFICTFADVDALEAYAVDPRHRALGARLIAMCTKGVDSIMVADLETK